MVVSINQELALLAVAREVDLEDPPRRYPGQVVERIEAVVVRAHEDVVYVEQDAAVGALGDASEELPLRHRVRGIGEVRRNVLKSKSAPDLILHAPDPIGHVAERRLGVGKGDKVVEIPTLDAGPAQMV